MIVKHFIDNLREIVACEVLVYSFFYSCVKFGASELDLALFVS